MRFLKIPALDGRGWGRVKKSITLSIILPHPRGRKSGFKEHMIRMLDINTTTILHKEARR